MNNITYMDRNIELENRINKRRDYDILHGINSYGGMDGSVNEKKLRLEELDYIKTHPEIYRKNNQRNYSSMYLINLK